jgi:hypothetical protein
MSLQIRSQVAQRGKILHRKIASVGQCGIQARRRMSLGKHKPVSVLLLRILRIDIHLFKIEIGKYVRCGQGAARMSRFSAMYCGNDSLANFISCFL